jgi:signal transduction histidine kinase/ActR/RegA family two-component response regulator
MPDFQALFEAAPGLFLVLTPDLRIVAVSSAYLHATMTAREDIIGLGIFEVFPDNPDDPTASGVRNLRDSLHRVLATREPDTMPVQKYDVRRPGDGGFEVRYWSPLNTPVLDSNCAVSYIIHRVEDVTEFIRIKQANRDTEEQRQALATRAEAMEAEVYLRSQEVAEANRRLRNTNDALGSLYQQISLLMSHADHVLSVRENADQTAAEPVNPEAMLGRIAQLIAGHLLLEEQLRQAQKMEAVGQLAGGVAHDFNNLLTVITGYATLLRNGLPPEVGTVAIDEIEHAVDSAASLTRKLLAFSRKQILQPRVIDVNSVITGMEELLRRLIGEHVHLITVLEGGLGKVRIDPAQLEQVVMNLVINARDAMAGGGRIIIETRNIQLDPGQVGSLLPGPYVVLSVKDNGHGIDDAILAKIFDPFFTTKEIGKGTGLGLSTAFGIVEQSDGVLTARSVPGEGATFLAYFPRIEGDLDIDQSATVARGHAVHRLSVLLVEDQAPLRTLLAKVLVAAGHQVVEAADGNEALALAENHRIDLIVTDVVMPGMNGTEVAVRVRDMVGNLPILYMSGYDQQLLDPNTLESNVRFMPKPFTPRKLLATIQELQRQSRNASKHATGNGGG